ncbi:MAG: hypothetical protein ACOCQD_04460, partial [archaeon]
LTLVAAYNLIRFLNLKLSEFDADNNNQYSRVESKNEPVKRTYEDTTVKTTSKNERKAESANTLTYYNFLVLFKVIFGLSLIIAGILTIDVYAIEEIYYYKDRGWITDLGTYEETLFNGIGAMLIVAGVASLVVTYMEYRINNAIKKKIEESPLNPSKTDTE